MFLWKRILVLLSLYVVIAVSAMWLGGCEKDCPFTERYSFRNFTRIEAVDYNPALQLYVVGDTLINRLMFEFGAEYERTVEGNTPVFPNFPLKSSDFFPSAYAKDCIAEQVTPQPTMFAVYFDRPVKLRTSDGFLRQVPALTNLDPYVKSTLAPVPDLYVNGRPDPFSKRMEQFRIEFNTDAVRLDTGWHEVGFRYVFDNTRAVEMKKKFYYGGK